MHFGTGGMQWQIWTLFLKTKDANGYATLPSCRPQLVVICGRNAGLLQRLAALGRPNGMRLLPCGFVDNIHEWMAACDVIVTKVGSRTGAAAGGGAFVVAPPCSTHARAWCHWCSHACCAIDVVVIKVGSSTAAST